MTPSSRRNYFSQLLISCIIAYANSIGGKIFLIPTSLMKEWEREILKGERNGIFSHFMIYKDHVHIFPFGEFPLRFRSCWIYNRDLIACRSIWPVGAVWKRNRARYVFYNAYIYGTVLRFEWRNKISIELVNLKQTNRTETLKILQLQLKCLELEIFNSPLKRYSPLVDYCQFWFTLKNAYENTIFVPFHSLPNCSVHDEKTGSGPLPMIIIRLKMMNRRNNHTRIHFDIDKKLQKHPSILSERRRRCIQK